MTGALPVLPAVAITGEGEYALEFCWMGEGEGEAVLVASCPEATSKARLEIGIGSRC